MSDLFLMVEEDSLQQYEIPDKRGKVKWIIPNHNKSDTMLWLKDSPLF